MNNSNQLPSINNTTKLEYNYQRPVLSSDLNEVQTVEASNTLASNRLTKDPIQFKYTISYVSSNIFEIKLSDFSFDYVDYNTKDEVRGRIGREFTFNLDVSVINPSNDNIELCIWYRKREVDKNSKLYQDGFRTTEDLSLGASTSTILEELAIENKIDAGLGSIEYPNILSSRIITEYTFTVKATDTAAIAPSDSDREGDWIQLKDDLTNIVLPVCKSITKIDGVISRPSGIINCKSLFADGVTNSMCNSNSSISLIGIVPCIGTGSNGVYNSYYNNRSITGSDIYCENFFKESDLTSVSTYRRYGKSCTYNPVSGRIFFNSSNVYRYDCGRFNNDDGVGLKGFIESVNNEINNSYANSAVIEICGDFHTVNKLNVEIYGNNRIILDFKDCRYVEYDEDESTSEPVFHFTIDSGSSLLIRNLDVQSSKRYSGIISVDLNLTDTSLNRNAVHSISFDNCNISSYIADSEGNSYTAIEINSNFDNGANIPGLDKSIINFKDCNIDVNLINPSVDICGIKGISLLGGYEVYSTGGDYGFCENEVSLENCNISIDNVISSSDECYAVANYMHFNYKYNKPILLINCYISISNCITSSIYGISVSSNDIIMRNCNIDIINCTSHKSRIYGVHGYYAEGSIEIYSSKISIIDSNANSSIVSTSSSVHSDVGIFGVSSHSTNAHNAEIEISNCSISHDTSSISESSNYYSPLSIAILGINSSGSIENCNISINTSSIIETSVSTLKISPIISGVGRINGYGTRSTPNVQSSMINISSCYINSDVPAISGLGWKYQPMISGVYCYDADSGRLITNNTIRVSTNNLNTCNVVGIAMLCSGNIKSTISNNTISITSCSKNSATDSQVVGILCTASVYSSSNNILELSDCNIDVICGISLIFASTRESNHSKYSGVLILNDNSRVNCSGPDLTKDSCKGIVKVRNCDVNLYSSSDCLSVSGFEVDSYDTVNFSGCKVINKVLRFNSSNEIKGFNGFYSSDPRTHLRCTNCDSILSISGSSVKTISMSDSGRVYLFYSTSMELSGCKASVVGYIKTSNYQYLNPIVVFIPTTSTAFDRKSQLRMSNCEVIIDCVPSSGSSEDAVKTVNPVGTMLYQAFISNCIFAGGYTSINISVDKNDYVSQNLIQKYYNHSASGYWLISDIYGIGYYTE